MTMTGEPCGLFTVSWPLEQDTPGWLARLVLSPRCPAAVVWLCSQCATRKRASAPRHVFVSGGQVHLRGESRFGDHDWDGIGNWLRSGTLETGPRGYRVLDHLDQPTGWHRRVEDALAELARNLS